MNDLKLEEAVKTLEGLGYTALAENLKGTRQAMEIGRLGELGGRDIVWIRGPAGAFTEEWLGIAARAIKERNPEWEGVIFNLAPDQEMGVEEARKYAAIVEPRLAAMEKCLKQALRFFRKIFTVMSGPKSQFHVGTAKMWATDAIGEIRKIGIELDEEERKIIDAGA